MTEIRKDNATLFKCGRGTPWSEITVLYFQIYDITSRYKGGFEDGERERERERER